MTVVERSFGKDGVIVSKTGTKGIITMADAYVRESLATLEHAAEEKETVKKTANDLAASADQRIDSKILRKLSTARFLTFLSWGQPPRENRLTLHPVVKNIANRIALPVAYIN